MGVLNQHMKQVVDQLRLGFVATVCPDGTPNVSPKGTLCVLDDEHLIFADIRSPGTVANLRSNQNIEVNVVDPFSRKGYRFKGLAVVHEQGPVFEEFVAFFAKRKLPDAPRRIKSIVVIGVVSAKPLISPAYDEGAITGRCGSVEAVLLWSRSIRGLTARSRGDAPKSGAPLNANVRPRETHLNNG